MPEEMQILLKDYLREEWDSHPDFRDRTKQWLGAHRMFRQLVATVISDTENYLDRNKDVQDYLANLSYRVGVLAGTLHGHHGWENHSYFPELSAADSRFDKGLEILKKDHAVLHQVLDHFTALGNRIIHLASLDEAQVANDVGKLHSTADIIESLLQRYLGDEEELAVPIILHHRLRG